jgi:hypothetical protein
MHASRVGSPDYAVPLPSPAPFVMLSEAKHLWLFSKSGFQRRSGILRFAQDDNADC